MNTLHRNIGLTVFLSLLAMPALVYAAPYGIGTYNNLEYGRAMAASSTVLTTSQSADAQTLILTATITPSDAQGSVSFADGSQSLGGVTAVNGVATLQLPAFSYTTGTHSFTAIYAGSMKYSGSVSNSVSPTISMTPTGSSGGGGSGGGGRRSTDDATTTVSSSSITSSANRSGASSAMNSGQGSTAGGGTLLIPILATSNLRKASTTSSSVVTLLQKGWMVSLLGIDGQWAHVRTVSGKEGYMLKKYVQIAVASSVSSSASSASSSPIASAANVRYVTYPVHLRAAPSKQAKSLLQLPTGSPVTLVEVLIDWAKVQTSSGKIGYLLRMYLRK